MNKIIDLILYGAVIIASLAVIFMVATLIWVVSVSMFGTIQ